MKLPRLKTTDAPVRVALIVAALSGSAVMTGCGAPDESDSIQQAVGGCETEDRRALALKLINSGVPSLDYGWSGQPFGVSGTFQSGKADITWKDSNGIAVGTGSLELLVPTTSVLPRSWSWDTRLGVSPWDQYWVKPISSAASSGTNVMQFGSDGKTIYQFELSELGESKRTIHCNKSGSASMYYCECKARLFRTAHFRRQKEGELAQEYIIGECDTAWCDGDGIGFSLQQAQDVAYDKAEAKAASPGTPTTCAAPLKSGYTDSDGKWVSTETWLTPARSEMGPCACDELIMDPATGAGAV